MHPVTKNELVEWLVIGVWALCILGRMHISNQVMLDETQEQLPQVFHVSNSESIDVFLLDQDDFVANNLFGLPGADSSVKANAKTKGSFPSELLIRWDWNDIDGVTPVFTINAFSHPKIMTGTSIKDLLRTSLVCNEPF